MERNWDIKAWNPAIVQEGSGLQCETYHQQESYLHLGSFRLIVDTKCLLRCSSAAAHPN